MPDSNDNIATIWPPDDMYCASPRRYPKSDDIINDTVLVGLNKSFPVEIKELLFDVNSFILSESFIRMNKSFIV